MQFVWQSVALLTLATMRSGADSVQSLLAETFNEHILGNSNNETFLSLNGGAGDAATIANAAGATTTAALTEL